GRACRPTTGSGRAARSLRSRGGCDRAARRHSGRRGLSARPRARNDAPCARAGVRMSVAGATGWVGRSIRRLEDPALIAGRGRFTADLPAAHRVRFVRSQHAAGRITNIAAPDGVMVITAADLKDIKPIRPMLHKFDYVPIGQPVLAADRVRFVGEAIAAVVASTDAQAEDAADAVEVDIATSDAVIDAQAALGDGAPRVHDEVAGNVIVKGTVETPEFASARASADRLV